MEKKSQKTEKASPVPHTYRDTSMEEIPAEALRAALLPLHESCKPLDEMIATAEATYEFIRNTELDIPTRNAFYRLEKQFHFYRDLVEKEE